MSKCSLRCRQSFKGYRHISSSNTDAFSIPDYVVSHDWKTVNNDLDGAREEAVVFYLRQYLKICLLVEEIPGEILEEMVSRLRVEMGPSTRPILLT